MAKYGNGISFKQACEYEREGIEHALRGELVCDESEEGFVYAKASKEECDKFILSAYDEVVYQAIRAFTSGRALERIAEERGGGISLQEYMEKVDEVERGDEKK